MISPEVDVALDLSSCENEPIHIPGFIQPHGVLLALDWTAFVIEQVSENSRLLLGLPAEDLIGKSPAAFLGERQSQALIDSIGARASDSGTTDVIAGPNRELMECSFHRSGNLLLIELQPVMGAHSLDLLDISLSLQGPLSRMERSANVNDLVSVVAKEIRTISGFDRVMVYRFDEDWHGQVLAEEVSDRYRVDYLGMHFPASDIPAQARKLYVLNRLRLIPDIGYVPVPIIADRPLRPPLDLSRSDLRSVSPIHIEYLHNIGVRATLTISILVRGNLWGLVACHHTSPRRLNRAVRSTCDFFAQMLALKLSTRIDHADLSQRLDATERLAKFIAGLESTQSLCEGLRRYSSALLPIFDGDALFIRGPEGMAVYGTALTPAMLLPAITRLEKTATATSRVAGPANGGTARIWTPPATGERNRRVATDGAQLGRRAQARHARSGDRVLKAMAIEEAKQSVECLLRSGSTKPSSSRSLSRGRCPRGCRGSDGGPSRWNPLSAPTSNTWSKGWRT
jgi:chemotaxis family two-component system sensor kinase Cph1